MTSIATREAQARTERLPQPGIYRHFKGGEYELLSVARHSETEELLAVYRATAAPEDIWVRPLDMFTGTVELEEGEILRFQFAVRRQAQRQLNLRPRFRRLTSVPAALKDRFGQLPAAHSR